MSRTEDVEVVLSRAKGLEKKCDWLKAVDLYEQVLRAVGKEELDTISTPDNVKLSKKMYIVSCAHLLFHLEVHLNSYVI